MSIIKVDGRGATATTIEKLEAMIKNSEANPGDYYAVELNYNAHEGLGAEETPEFYPVKFKGIRGQELWLSYVTLGYRGEGPRGTQTALKLMGFDTLAENEQVLFEQKVVCETFFKEAGKDDRIEYYYDAMYETTAHLNQILDGGISEETIKEFERVAFSLKWEGRHARRFREVTSQMTDELRFREPTEEEIKFVREIADYPRKCANAMAAKDQAIANMIDKVISAFNG